MTRTAELFDSSIVALGAFNPAIFSPDWFERNGLLGVQDAKIAREAQSLIVTRQYTMLDTEWFVLQVQENQFVLQNKDALSPALKDLASGILTLVTHTPITAIGLNFMGHYRMASMAEYHKVGDVLAPKKIWDTLYKGSSYSAGMEHLMICIRKTPREAVSKTEDAIRISVQTSSILPPRSGIPGILLSYNDHREIRVNEADNRTSAEVAVKIVESDWQTSWSNAIRVFDDLLTTVLAED